jgi:endonuclease YncB( thermonuclease family)
MTKKILLYSVLVLSLIFFSGCCNHRKKVNNDYTGKVVKIIDGDTYDLLLKNDSTIRIRMNGIDAPERGMPYSKKATKYLGELCQKQCITIKKTSTDRYNRTLAFSYLKDGRELGKELLKAGLAWHYKEYNSDPELAALEDEARKARRGLWHDENPMAPWEYRRLHQQGISTKGMIQTNEKEE